MPQQFQTAYANMTLSLLLDGVDWASDTVSIYDCSRFKHCRTCLSDMYKFPCSWCTTTHKCMAIGTYCMPSPNSEEVVVNVLDKCPAVSPSAKQQTLYHVEQPISFAMTSTNMKLHFSLTKCNFTIMTYDPRTMSHVAVRSVTVDGSISSNQNRDLVTCNPVVLTYDTTELQVTVKVEFLANGHIIDSTEKIYFTLYKCENKASTCGRCQLIGPNFNCNWCYKEKQGQRANFCSFKDKCESGFAPNEICQNPQIASINPLGGPLVGGTTLTINGSNLGFSEQEVKILINNINCPITGGYLPTELIKCTTPKSTIEAKVDVTVIVSGKYTAKSPQQFYYKNFKVADISPKVGMKSGGTNVTIRGADLDFGSMCEVKFDNKLAPVIYSRNSTHISLRTPQQTTAITAKVKVSIDSHVEVQQLLFQYKKDPVIKSLSPTTSLISGGRQITVDGETFDLLSKASIIVLANEKNFSEPCVLKSADTMFCYSPNITGILFEEDTTSGTFKVGFKLDETIMNNTDHTLRYYYHPLFQNFGNIVIKNAYDEIEITVLNNPESLVDLDNALKVKVDGAFCGHSKYDDEKVKFVPAYCKKNGDNHVSDRDVPVEVTINKFSQFVGTLRYPKSIKTALVLGLLFGLVLPLIIGCTILGYCLFKRNRKKWLAKRQHGHPPVLDAINRVNATGDGRNIYNQEPGMAEVVPLNTSQEYLNPAQFLNDEQYLNALLEKLDDQNLRSAAQQVYIARERLEMGNQLGRGHFGKVHAATLRDINMKNPVPVAVKTIDDPEVDQKVIEGFLKEGIIMKNFTHDHVLSLLGLCLGYKKEPMVVLPFMANGDLRSYVKDKKRSFTARQLLHLAQQVAEGMSYLASLNFIHRDLAARNCMIDDKSQVKVADFGLSHQLHDSEYYSSKNRKAKLPIKWMALESLENYVFTVKSDVWSFGVLLWELMTRGVTPYPDVDVFETRNYLASGRRLYKPKFCPENVYQVMMECWQETPERRPTFTDLVNRLEVLLNPPKQKPGGSADGDSPKEPTYINVTSPELPQDYLKPIASPPDDDAAAAATDDDDEDESDDDEEEEEESEEEGERRVMKKKEAVV